MSIIRDLIFACDPGGTSGFAAIQHSIGREFSLLTSIEYTWKDRFKLFNIIYQNKARLKALVIEDYVLFDNPITLHAQIGSNIPSARVIGILELAAKLCKLDCVYFQTPQNKDQVSVLPEHKHLIGRSLKYPKKYSQHCIDAYCHARYHVLTQARKTHEKH